MSVGTFDIKKILEVLKNTDVLISGRRKSASGSHKPEKPFVLPFCYSAALHYKKRVIIFAQGIGPIKNLFGRLLTKSVLKKMHLYHG